MKDKLGIISVVGVLNRKIERVAECLQRQFGLLDFVVIPGFGCDP